MSAHTLTRKTEADPSEDQFIRWESLWGLPCLSAEVTIEISPRMTTSLGRCYPQRALIRLNPIIFEQPDHLRDEVLCHELAHVAAFRLHGAGVRPHGREWAHLMELAGFPARLRLPVRVDPPRRRSQRRYRYSCPICRTSRITRKRMNKWRCARCYNAGHPGQLNVTQLK